MAGKRTSFIDRLAHKRTMRRWARAARNADETKLSELRGLRSAARLLRSHLDRLIHRADERLALPAIGSTAFPRPHNADWFWRPELWRGSLKTPGMSSVQTKSMLGNEVTLFHDCEFSELTLRQLRNLREEDLAPYGVRLDVFKFDGSFLSLVVDLPEDAVSGLTKNHLVGMNTIVEMEKPLEIFARLNVRHGPNTEQIVRELPLNEQDVTVEFDLAYSKLNEKRVERAWIDLIFEGPEMNQVTLRDLTFSRRPRAAL
ncbi:hypothetical protein KUV51_09930 [Tateyamaria omphalii]|uniref:DUF6478 family protein n=1 Tax=Tateyamaria omphalii TaxID=299262 RepID=UPI001C9A018A|nr:DUF6478 family protein [Tateyamaria omphalii]MBY5933316.1 hypothetical protein [Tateyamaria omphalii]